MLEIIINNISLDLPENIAIPVTLKNSFFSTGIVEGDLAYQSSAPLTDTNKKAISFMHQVSSTSAFSQQFDCTIKFGGGIFSEGKMIVTKIAGGKMFFRIAIGKSIFFNRLSGISLQDLDLSAITLGSGIPADNVSNTFYRQPVIYNPSFTAVDADLINGVDLTSRKSAFLFLKYVMEALFAYGGNTLAGNFFEDADIQKLLIYNNRVLDLPAIPTSGDIIGDAPEDLVPPQSALDLLSAIITGFCLHMEGGKLSTKKSILESAAELDITQYAGKIDEVEPAPYTGYHFKYNDDTEFITIQKATEFISSGTVAAFANLPVIDEPGTIRYVTADKAWYKWKEDFEVEDDVATVPDLPGSADVGEIYYVHSSDGYKEWDGAAWIALTVEPWEFYLYDMSDLVVDGGGEIIQPKFSSLARAHTDGGTFDFNKLRIDEEGIWEAFNHAGAVATIRLLFAIAGGDASPISDGNYSLHWSGTSGLYEKFHKRFVQFKKNAKLCDNVPMWLPWPLINNYAAKLFSQKLRIGQNQFMMEELSFTLRKHTITDQQATLYTV